MAVGEKIYLKDLAHAFVGLQVWILQGRWQSRVDTAAQVQSQSADRISFPQGQSLLLRPSTDWMRPTHNMEGNLLYSKSTKTNVD